MIDILDEMLHAEYLPFIRDGRRTHYIGSIDKKQRNYDCNWTIYEDKKYEWVLFEQYGAGCVFNFVQHRMPYVDDPIFRFYFDGEEKPRFEIRHSQFGEKRPFTEPLAGAFAGPYFGLFGGTYIRVVRSFVPMPFKTHCKITCNVKLEDKHPGGWGHVIYQTFSEDEPVSSFDPNDPRYNELEALWAQKGRSPIRTQRRRIQRRTDICLSAGESSPVFADHAGGMITSLKIRTTDFSEKHLSDLWIRASWDGHGGDDLNLPVGSLFGNELGHHAVSYLFSGMDADGGYYCFYPMPYAQEARIIIENRGEESVLLEEVRVEYTDEFNESLKSVEWGYFKNSPYHAKSCPGNKDSIIGEVTGEKGRIVGAVITGYPYEEGGRADCEGNVHLHFDGLRSPQILSDGSESYVCYGWGFCAPPQCNSLTGYDGKKYFSHMDWSMCRQSPYEGYPFLDGFRFGIESFAYNDQLMFHSGTILYYGTGTPGLKLLSAYGTETERLTACFEGDDDDQPVTLTGDRGCEIVLDVPVCGARALVIRRVSDQAENRQMAHVYVNDVKLDKPWYVLDSNPVLRWLEDEYAVPGAAIEGNDRVCIRIEPVECAGRTAFNQFGIRVFGAM